MADRNVKFKPNEQARGDDGKEKFPKTDYMF